MFVFTLVRVSYSVNPTSCVVFFQAEDGIRDLVRSRGLGDVYKRQVHSLAKIAVGGSLVLIGDDDVRQGGIGGDRAVHPVSYTHLTLPTSDLV